MLRDLEKAAAAPMRQTAQRERCLLKLPSVNARAILRSRRTRAFPGTLGAPGRGPQAGLAVARPFPPLPNMAAAYSSPAKPAAVPRRRPGALLIALALLLCWTWSTSNGGRLGNAVPSALSFPLASRLAGSGPGIAEHPRQPWLPAGAGGSAVPRPPPTCDLDVSTGPLAQSCRLVTDVCVDQVRRCR